MRALSVTVAAGAVISLAAYVFDVYFVAVIALLVACGLAGALLDPRSGLIAALLLSIPIWALPTDRSIGPVVQPDGCDPFCDTGQSAAAQLGSFGVGVGVLGALAAWAVAFGMSRWYQGPRASR